MKSKLLVFRILMITAFAFSVVYLSLKVFSNTSNFNENAELETLHQRLAKPLPGEWLSIVKEPGQTFEQYVSNKPNRITEKRNKIYIRPIGSFSDAEKRSIELTSKYLEQFYGVSVEILDSISVELIPKSSIRIHQNTHQASAKYILNDILAPNIPDAAAGYIAFTKIDLYNDPKNNFVFGLGHTKNRTGVYSMARLGDPNSSKSDYKTFILRMLKIASHELGHILGIRHCIAYECLMNGSNSLTETDLKPVYMCPVDSKKVCWNMELDKVERFMKLQSFWAENDFQDNSDFYYKNITLLAPAIYE